ncbi:hypothetical protein BH24ACT5_BH24ACT5_23100 [soil metagenome]
MGGTTVGGAATVSAGVEATIAVSADSGTEPGDVAGMSSGRTVKVGLAARKKAPPPRSMTAVTRTNTGSEMPGVTQVALMASPMAVQISDAASSHCSHCHPTARPVAGAGALTG